jgi:hypothetical protein
VDDLQPGERFAGCRIEAVAGRGGMGIVYRATEIALSRRVALKVVAPAGVADPAFAERFGREVRLAASIDHPNVVPVYGAGEEGGRLYLVMRYVDGTDLHALIRRAGRLEPARAAAIVAQVAAGLDAAHVAGLVHRDVKPANVLLTHAASPSGHDHVYLTDFGLTVEVSSDTRMTTSGQWIGSVDYMSPEQLRNEPVDARTDVYALGGVLYAALTGDAPFRRQTVPQTIAAHLDERPPRPSAKVGVDTLFDAVIARALAKDPADRYRSAGDLGRAAVAAARGERVTSGERVVARGPAAPSDEPTRRLGALVPSLPEAPTDVVAGLRGAAGGDAPSQRPEAEAASGAPAPSADPGRRRIEPAPPPAAHGAPSADPGRRRIEPTQPPAAHGAAAAPADAARRRLVPAPAPAPAPLPVLAGRAGKANAAAPPGSDAQTAHVKRTRGRRRSLRLLALTLVAAAAAGVAVAVATGGGAGRGHAQSASLSAGEIGAVARDFASAYGDEDAAALRATLASDVQRVAPDGVTEGRDDVLAVYRRQFAAAQIDAYELDGLKIVRGAAGRAAGSYTVKRSGSDDVKGLVAFGVVREAGRAKIAMIATQPQ